MKTAIMQPYFLPYLGYFQLIAAVDRFVVYDTIQYTKKGWINRNQMLRDGAAVVFSLPLKAGSDFLDVRDRHLADSFDASKFCAKIEGAYRKAPEFGRTMPMIEQILNFKAANLFDFIFNSIRLCCGHLGLKTPLFVSSQVEDGRSTLKGTERVIDICRRTGATCYVNSPGGRPLYAPEVFRSAGLELKFLQPRLLPYAQFGAPFLPYLSILDVMMFNSPDAIGSRLIGAYDLVD